MECSNNSKFDESGTSQKVKFFSFNMAFELNNEIIQNKNCVVFSSFNNLVYMKVSDKYSIQIPDYLRKWLISLLTMINTVDMNNEIDAFSWMVLMYPSLLLIQSSTYDQTLVKLTNKTIETFRKCMINEAKISQLSLNDILICVELHGYTSPDVIPMCVWDQLNNLLESMTSLNKFLEMTCLKKKDGKLIKDLLNYKISQMSNEYSKIRKMWILLITPYTQICRLNRLLKMKKYNSDLTTKSKQNVNKLCHIFDNKYNFMLKQLFIALKKKTDCIKMHYSYLRYKTMAMCTHTNTTIPPTFSGYIGYFTIDVDIDIRSLTCMIDGLYDDVVLFINTVNDILSEMKKNSVSINIENIKKKISTKKINNLRILDHICFNSVCVQLIFESIHGNQNNGNIAKMYYKKIIQIRHKMKLALDVLATNALLFTQKMNNFDDIVQMEFLTDDKNEKECWMRHLMSGILFNYWVRNE